MIDGTTAATTVSGDGCSTLNYSSVLLLATFVAETLRRRLPLEVAPGSGPEAASSVALRIGVALPEGPFLPLFVLAIHSLNMAAAGGWLDCTGVVLVPLESDGATERLGRILSDSKPDLIVVGGSLEGMRAAMDGGDGNTSIVDFTTVVDEALYFIDKSGDCSLLTERLWPAELRGTAGTQPGHYDAAKLVAMGAIRLATSFAETPTIRQANEREIMSHIVYTSGTTGKPKGCVSSLASLRHYIAAKNTAHEIDSTSRVLLASAITFDPCFSDVLATFAASGTICVASRGSLHGGGMTGLLQQLKITHVLCTPTLWSTVEGDANSIEGLNLKVVALGGEPIPRAMIGRWARQRRVDCSGLDWAYNCEYPRLCATYGVTEACVYQTFGEVVLGDTSDNEQARRGNAVGFPLQGSYFHICRPHSADTNQGNPPGLEHIDGGSSVEPNVGEVVLSGAQIDAMSSYLNQSDLTRLVFLQGDNDIEGGNFFYRTGDLGYIDAQSKQLYIMGRIKGDGMVKVNGIRLELSEVEASIVDGSEALADHKEGHLVVDCMACLTTTESDDNQQNKKQLVAYCILSEAAIDQIGLDRDRLRSGLIVSQGPLLTVLRTRCDRRLRKGCTPSFFVLIDRLPLSPTGKRDRSALPPLSRCNVLMGSEDSKSLWSLGKVGATVANQICEILNLQPCQRQLVTEGRTATIAPSSLLPSIFLTPYSMNQDATFFILGGDSLAATLVVRGLYARHHGITNSRNLGGSTGTLEGYFAAKHLLTASSLGDYVQFLDSNGAFGPTSEKALNATDVTQEPNTANEDGKDPMYDSLIKSITLGYTSIASALLDLNVDPNSQPNQGRLGKVGDRRQQRAMFKSNPLHLACLR